MVGRTHFSATSPRSLARVVVSLIATVFLAMLAGRAEALSARTQVNFTPPLVDTSFGYDVANIGDFNGDGYTDWVVGAPMVDTGASDGGAVYVYFGGPNADGLVDLTLLGSEANAQFGFSVAGAGDVNKDGYADIIVGAPFSNAVVSNGGQAFVYFGGPSPNATADLTLTGLGSTGQFGYSVSGAGDVNGDGYADLVVGAPYDDSYSTDFGKLYVYFGAPVPDQVADQTMNYNPWSQQVRQGFSVTGGDVNGDAYSDIITGIPYYSGDQGGVLVYFGGQSGPPSTYSTYSYGEGGSYFGWDVAYAGKINSDRYGDVVVGSPRWNGNMGRAYAMYDLRSNSYYGNSATFTGEVANDQFGAAVGAAGDVDGDGLGDVVIGAPGSDIGELNAGAIYVYSSTGSLLATLGGTLASRIGQSVAGTGDINRDGFNDVLIGGQGNARATLLFPYLFLYPNGQETFAVGQQTELRWYGKDKADLAFSNDAGLTWTTLGSRVGGLDYNSQIVSIPNVTTAAGKFRLSYTGQTANQSNSDQTDGVFRIVPKTTAPAVASRAWLIPTGGAATDSMGASVASAGDVNGDGYSDYLVGAPKADAGTSNEGRAYLYYGGPTADNVADLTLIGFAAGDELGYSVSGAGDMNGDGYADLIVGVPYNDNAGTDAGRAYVYFGGPGMDSNPDLVLNGQAAGDTFGRAVAAAGDANGDGFGDVIVGAMGNDAVGSNAGRAYIFLGGFSPDATADVTLTGVAVGDLFGSTVAGVGDENGDGYGDVLVGAPGRDGTAADAGAAYLFYGALSPDTTPDLIVNGEAAGDLFGAAAASAGDVNDDGFADLIIGAPGSDSPASGAGSAYLYWGGTVANDTPDVIFRGTAGGDAFGSAVAALGDINGDGYGDLAIGAPYSDFNGNDAGRAYLFYGGPGPDALPDVALRGAAAGDHFGVSIAGVGSMTGDGFFDVAVGAPDADANGTDSGRAYVFDCKRYFLAAPNGGDSWPVGALRTIRWTGSEPADIYLSTNGGRTFDLLVRSVGGAADNSYALRVPQAPTRFANIRVQPTSSEVTGHDDSDSLFTIQIEVQLLALLAAPAPLGAPGVVLTWNTNPGPDDLNGYRIDRASGSGAYQTLVSLTRETTYTDAAAGPGTRYRLFAINGFGQEILMGETSLRPAKPLAAWPLPYRGGDLNVAFATASAIGGGAAPADVAVFDVTGRLVRNLARGSYGAGLQTVVWDGRNTGGRRVAAGIYFIRSQSGDHVEGMKIAVLR